MGLRALLEGVCADKGIEGNHLKQRIDRLDTVLPAHMVAKIHAFRFMGNAAVHELEAPKRSTLKLALEVMVDLLGVLYELEKKLDRLGRGG